MNNRNIIVAAVIFVLIVIGMFIFAYLNAPDNEVVEPVQNEEQDTVSGPYDHIERIDAKHFYSEGVHTLVGEMMMPTPCDLLTWDTQIAESFPEQALINFEVTNNAEVCAQQMTPQRFKVEFTASEDASVRARIEGRDVELNLIPPQEGESPDDFELFIKG